MEEFSMETTICINCEQPIQGKRFRFLDYLEYGKLDPNIYKYEIGSECQHCGATYCNQCKKKHLKFSLWKGGWTKLRCTQCGEPLGPGYLILSQDASISEATPELIWTTMPSIDKDTFSRIAKMLDERKWEHNATLKELLLSQLKMHGKPFLFACLKEVALDLPITQQGKITKINQIGALAEVGAAWLFEDGITEDWLVYKLEQGIPAGDATSFFLVKSLIAIETATKSGKHIPVLTNILLHAKIVDVRADAARELGAIDWDTRVVDALLEAMKDRERPHRMPEVSLAVSKPEPASVQQRAILSLIQIGDERGLSAVIPILAMEDKYAKFTEIDAYGLDTIELLTEIGMKSPPSLINALQHEELQSSQIARIALALGNIDNHEAVSPLIQYLLHEDSGVRSSSAQALGKLGDPGAFESLLDLLTDKNRGVRLDSNKALKKIAEQQNKDPQIHAYLMNALVNQNPEVRAFAAEMIGTLGLVTATDSLDIALEDEDREVRDAAKQALKRIERKK
jgi:HEAT repeat protein